MTQSSYFSRNWKWKYSNGRNKLTANETSNKNASNNVSFVFSAVSCFHWLLLADKKHNLPFSETFCLLLQIVFFLTLSTVSMMTCDLQVIQSQLLYSSRWELRVCGSEQKKLICFFPNAFLKTPQFIRVAYDGYALKVFDVWILLCSTASPGFLVMERRRKDSERHIWDDMTVRGGFGSVQESLWSQSACSQRCVVLLRWLRRCALRFGVLSSRRFAAPGGIVAQSRGAVEIVLVVQAVGGVILSVLQTGDQAFVLVPEFAAHQSRFTHDHHVLWGHGQEEHV